MVIERIAFQHYYRHHFEINFTITGAFKRLNFPDPPSTNNYVRYNVEDFGNITEFSVSLWIREYEDQAENMRYIFSYSSDGSNHGNDITIGRNVGDNLINICILGGCLDQRQRKELICRLQRAAFFHLFTHKYRKRYFRGRVTNFNQSDARKYCFLSFDRSKFETLPRKYRTLLLCYLSLTHLVYGKKAGAPLMKEPTI